MVTQAPFSSVTRWIKGTNVCKWWKMKLSASVKSESTKRQISQLSADRLSDRSV
ncbi:hypothetical protein JCM6292_2575 [Bacteroides pyogenes JCM 6292]|uniref:Uncharacterized protein n=2 Tax=Bacteroides pyogenes TaxID=310300 RepID=W4PJK5_9BACE|nr:hypothetical protein JCM6292_2575 [Bacteroides pyogenes JCM 6292]GAE19603.1 hypothetical protein JCM6294_2681 [Bacteroides pyogenes DSM 20611 = JCM 6294]